MCANIFIWLYEGEGVWDKACSISLPNFQIPFLKAKLPYNLKYVLTSVRRFVRNDIKRNENFSLVNQDRWLIFFVKILIYVVRCSVRHIYTFSFKCFEILFFLLFKKKYAMLSVLICAWISKSFSTIERYLPCFEVLMIFNLLYSFD